ncbi:unnamed protein product [Trifolium pratense]|uniref:Uncharacterized protein n=1 Tax=Trifolium pratense TaxID=57577 RepID=A0ACB0KWV0_TRIPR|nr:unnamed protein product [Trifolium pratense]
MNGSMLLNLFIFIFDLQFLQTEFLSLSSSSQFLVKKTKFLKPILHKIALVEEDEIKEFETEGWRWRFGDTERRR